MEKINRFNFFNLIILDSLKLNPVLHKTARDVLVLGKKIAANVTMAIISKKANVFKNVEMNIF